MAEVLPFRGIRYNTSRFPDISKVVCPPYDVISPEDRDRYYELDQYNCIRLILGREFTNDTQDVNQYTRAARYFQTWLSHGILVQDIRPAFYFVEERYQDEDGNILNRFGVIGLVRLMEYASSVVRPHELTHEGPKRDRLELMKASGANFSQIFTLYTDASHALDTIAEQVLQGMSHIEAMDFEGVRRRMYTVSDPPLLNQVQQVLTDKELLIADGHHRYETALAYREWRRAREGFDGRPQPYDYLMMYLTNTEGEGLTIYPTHRILANCSRWDTGRFLNQIKEVFDVEHIPGGPEPARCRQLLESMKGGHDQRVRIGMKCKTVDGYYLLTLRDQQLADRLMGDQVPPVLRRLDVKVLHAILLGHYLGIRAEEQEKRGNILYVKGVEKAITILEQDLLHQAVFFLNPPTISVVSDVVKAGEKMPQKSTFFYPKLLTGLVFRTVDTVDELDEDL